MLLWFKLEDCIETGLVSSLEAAQHVDNVVAMAGDCTTVRRCHFVFKLFAACAGLVSCLTMSTELPIVEGMVVYRFVLC